MIAVGPNLFLEAALLPFPPGAEPLQLVLTFLAKILSVLKGDLKKQMNSVQKLSKVSI